MSKYFSRTRVGKQNPNYKPKIKVICENCGKTFFVYPCKNRKFCSRDCAKNSEIVKAKRLKSLWKRPTKPEQKLINLIKKYNLPFKYVGNGEVIIGGLNPDFIESNGKKLIIEVFGDYWHKNSKRFKYTEKGRKQIFKRYGFKTLIIWESEINKLKDKDILEKIKNFMVF